ncbi:CLUMA_CG004555, isoform A [Clunio marinus]|uniref:CLUMA_CG004555, isoform A n=1 Tax=Clunio marinus TaxID=568069 RepID=A0A1J1HXJ8_9DIPT|nr:CLUMA_CG004555, isoform A [Clunio marinus]
MLNIENSFFLQHWEIVVISVSIVYFILKLRDNQKSSAVETNQQQVNDEETIDNDAKDGEVDTGDDELSPSLEVVNHIPYRGASVVLKGGVDEFYNMVNNRRSIRMISNKPVDIEIVKKCIHAAGTSPSGAHTEPWTFCLIKSADVKKQIREIIEAEEYMNYKQRMSKQWTADLKPLRTNHIKEYLTEAPYLILVFKQAFGFKANGERKTHYYNEISTSIAVGILLSALQSAGLSSLTTTPLNCGPALRSLLNRPQNEKLLVLLPVGYPTDNCEVPDLKRKGLDEIMEIY